MGGYQGGYNIPLKGESKYSRHLKLRKELESLYSACGDDQQRIDRLNSEIRLYQYSRYITQVLKRDYGSLGVPYPFKNLVTSRTGGQLPS